jgi:mRNA interferase HigB
VGAVEIAGSRCRPLAIDLRHVANLRLLLPLHKDPFVRLPLRQAQIEGLTLPTRDGPVLRQGAAANAFWTQPADIKAQYRSASIRKNRRVVFNIKGNDYRVIVAVAYKLQIVYVKFVGTHEQYDGVDAETVEMA